MNFNLDKCKAMHVGNKNNKNGYVIDGHNYIGRPREREGSRCYGE